MPAYTSFGPPISSGKRMHLASDYIHPTPCGGRCGMRVFLPKEERDAPVVICSELPTNEGSSITYVAEQLAAEVIRYHRLSPFGVDRAPPALLHGRGHPDLQPCRLLRLRDQREAILNRPD